MGLLETVIFLSKGILAVHITTGFCALGTFWLPVFTRKGGVNHRKIGAWYVNCMWVVVISAILLSIKNVIIGQYIGAVFLGFLALITAKPLWKGIAVLANKREMSTSDRRLDFALTASIIIGGAALLVTAHIIREHSMSIALMIFGILGLSNIGDLISQFKKEKLDWMQEHIIGMCTSGIAAHTAFFVFGASQFTQELLSNKFAWIPWVLPGVIGTIGIKWAVLKYQPKRQNIPAH